MPQIPLCVTFTITCSDCDPGRDTSSRTSSPGAVRTIAFICVPPPRVHRIPGALPLSSHDLLRRLRLQLHERLLRVEARVRRDDDVVASEERRWRRRLLRHHVERGARQRARIERVGERGFIDNRPRAVFTRYAPGFICRTCPVEEPARLRHERRVHGHVVGAAEQFLELDALHAHA